MPMHNATTRADLGVEERSLNLKTQARDSSSLANEVPSLKLTDPVTRTEVVQAVLNLFDKPRYLEIGVQKGKTFNALTAAKKVAVDPKFRFDWRAAAAEGTDTHFYETTSDDFFGTSAAEHGEFNVIYLDGMHTSEQTTRDLLNAIVHLAPDGVILIDDVFPSSYLASLADINDYLAMHKASGATSGAWMGDVFRLVFFVETFCQQFSYGTVNDNHGQLILWREARDQVPQRTLTQVAETEYKDVYLEKAAFRFAPLNEILRRLQVSRS
jgi:hypothetical protein